MRKLSTSAFASTFSLRLLLVALDVVVADVVAVAALGGGSRGDRSCSGGDSDGRKVPGSESLINS